MIRKLFEQVIASIDGDGDEQPEDRETAIRLATAVLMIDVAKADEVFEDAEFDRTLELIRHHFELDSQTAIELVNEATDEADELVSLHSFTDVLHGALDEAEKAHVIELLWKVAYADGDLDKYEDSLVLKISDLLHVPRGRVMRLKHDASQQ